MLGRDWCRWQARARRNPAGMCCARDSRGNRSKGKPVPKGVITFPEFTPNLDWYTYVFKVTEFEGELIDCNEGTLEWVPYDQVFV